MLEDRDVSASPSAGPSGRRRLTRRSLLGLSSLAGLGIAAAGISAWASPGTPSSARPIPARTGPVTAPPPTGALAANFNSDPGVMTTPELQNIAATWIRGFFEMPLADTGNPAGQPVIEALLASAGQGYGTVLSLKFPYFTKPIPTPGTAAMALAQQRLATVLPAVMGKVDVLVIGNEPFVECLAADRTSEALNVFYEALAAQAIAYRGKNFPSGCKTALYMGALNRLEDPTWQTPVTDRWMQYVHNTAAIAGPDIHPHLFTPTGGSDYLNYILPRMRSDQKFLATEFSLVNFYARRLSDPVSATFATRYGLPAGTLAWQVIRDALTSPFPQAKWDDFLVTTPWFADHDTFLHDQMTAFRATGRLAVAGWGLGQDTAMSTNFGPGSTPWVLNSIYCLHTVQPVPGGLPGQTTVWADQFRALQHA